MAEPLEEWSAGPGPGHGVRRPEGLSAIDVSVNDKAAILEAAHSINAVTAEEQIYLCGVRINLV